MCFDVNEKDEPCFWPQRIFLFYISVHFRLSLEKVKERRSRLVATCCWLRLIFSSKTHILLQHLNERGAEDLNCCFVKMPKSIPISPRWSGRDIQHWDSMEAVLNFFERSLPTHSSSCGKIREEMQENQVSRGKENVDQPRRATKNIQNDTSSKIVGGPKQLLLCINNSTKVSKRFSALVIIWVLYKRMVPTIYVDSNPLLHILSHSSQYTYFLSSGPHSFTFLGGYDLSFLSLCRNKLIIHSYALARPIDQCNGTVRGLAWSDCNSNTQTQLDDQRIHLNNLLHAVRLIFLRQKGTANHEGHRME